MLSPEVEKLVQSAINEAQERRHEFATVEHLCFVLFENPKVKNLLNLLGVSKAELRQKFLDYIDDQIEKVPDEYKLETIPSIGFQRVLQRAAVHIVSAGKEEVSAEHVLVAAFDEDESYAVYMMQQSGITRLDLVSVISHSSLDEEADSETHENFSGDEEEIPDEKGVLARYTICLTEQARKGELDLVIGREKEIERSIQVLSRRRKNNPLFVGEPGVGKTALAEGIAQKIVANEVPEYMQKSEMFLIDMGAMLAGARYRGDFENRMKSVLKAMESKKNAIMVIDEIHTVIGAGATTGSSMDASNLLKPILSKGHLRCIGSTTFKEYRNYFEKDRALARRFQKIEIDEPSIEECIEILQGIKKRYEEYHQVEIEDKAIELAVKLSARYLHERKLPDKAIDLVDEACARMRLTRYQGNKVTTINEKLIEEAVASMAHIPSRNVSHDDKKVLEALKKNLSANIFGQDHAIDQVTNAILLARAGLREKNKPIGCFLFTGPSGVGKTEVAKKLAESLGVKMVRFDMSEYMERHAASRLVGAPPGYVGYEQGGLLTDAINKSPYAVLLLDEIEKAHPDVFNMLLQVMDYGKLTDSNGRPTDFRHVILIMTSNVGARESEQNAIGFSQAQVSNRDEKAVKRLFSPEFRNRLDARINFSKLPEGVVIKIVKKFLAELEQQLKEKGLSISISEDAAKYLGKLGYNPSMGARPLARVIQEKIKKPLASKILFGGIEKGSNILIRKVGDEIKIDIKKELVSESDG